MTVWLVGELASWRVGGLASWRVEYLAVWLVGELAVWRVGESASGKWREVHKLDELDELGIFAICSQTHTIHVYIYIYIHVIQDMYAYSFV